MVLNFNVLLNSHCSFALSTFNISEILKVCTFYSYPQGLWAVGERRATTLWIWTVIYHISPIFTNLKIIWSWFAYHHRIQRTQIPIASSSCPSMCRRWFRIDLYPKSKLFVEIRDSQLVGTISLKRLGISDSCFKFSYKHQWWVIREGMDPFWEGGCTNGIASHEMTLYRFVELVYDLE